MTFTLRRVAGTAVLALAASALTLPLAEPAHAAAPVDRMWKVADPDGDKLFGLYSSDAGGAWALVEGSTKTHIRSLSSSADGTRIVYVRDSVGATDVREDVVVRDTDKRIVRVLDTRSANKGSDLYSPALSPDGTRAVWEVYNRAAKSSQILRSLVGSGPVSGLISGYSPYTFLTNGSVLVQDSLGRASTVDYVAGTRFNSPNVPGNAFGVHLSPDGTRLAWGLVTNSTSPYTARIEVAPFYMELSRPVIGKPVVIDSTAYNRSPSWSRDGSTIYYLRHNGASGAFADIWSAPSDGSQTATRFEGTTGDEIDVDVTSLPTSDTTPPGAAAVHPGAVLDGKGNATLSWTVPNDPDLSGVLVSRLDLFDNPSTQWFVPAPQTSFTDSTGFGGRWNYTFTAVDRAGNLQTDPVQNQHAEPVQIQVTFPDPTSAASPTAPFFVHFSPYASNQLTFLVDFKSAGASTWSPWVANQPGVYRTFGSPATTGVSATTSTPGASIVFRARATDQWGNTTPYFASGRAVVPYDQTKATFIGGTTVNDVRAWLGSYRRLWNTAQSAKVTLVGDRLQVIGWRCHRCGVLRIYEGSTLLATVDSYYASTSTPSVRRVLFTKTYPGVGTHTFIIRPVGTAGRPYVYLDGFGMRR